MSLRPGVTVIIPSIPPRAKMLARAVESALNQKVPPAAILVEVDVDREGAGAMRNRAIARTDTEWIAFLDDDDYFFPNHLEVLLGLAGENPRAAVCWSIWKGNRVYDWECRTKLHPTKCHKHRDFDFEDPHLFGISYLVRTEIAKQCEFPAPEEGHDAGNEDYAFLLQLRDRTEPDQWVHTWKQTWHYTVHGANTSGRPDKW